MLLSEDPAACAPDDPSEPELPAGIDGVVSVDVPESPVLLLEPAVSPAPAPVVAAGVFALAEEAAERASFLAQPEPLNTIEGVDIALRRTPPQTRQVSGRGLWMPWTTSNARPHEVHTYS